MINNFTKYQKIIDDFRGEVSKATFEAKFSARSLHIQKTDRFLLKMELKRLNGDCTRLIDLRGHVDGECKEYVHEERSHYLDDIAIKVFEENITLYGKYTLGVYEAVTTTENNFRVIYQKEKAGLKVNQAKKVKVQKVFEKTQYPAQLFKFGGYYNRIEERMNFSIALLIDTEGNKVKCNSADLSVNGCKFRIPSTEKITLGQVISIRFLGLEAEFEFGSEDIFEYEIKNIQLIENVQLVGVKRIYHESNLLDGFQKFLKGFIQGNKRRYKINLDNTITALRSRTFEQYVLPKCNELPVYLSRHPEYELPKYALTSLNNRNIFEYWQDENKHSTLHCLITPERIKRLKSAFILGKLLLVYSFVHKSQGKYYFYTADEAQLKADPSFMAEFLGFAANKPDFAVTTLTIADINKDHINSFFTLSESITQQTQYLNLPVSDDIVEKINALSAYVAVNDVTSEELTSTYKAFPHHNIDFAKLKTFGHKRLSTPLNVEEISINYKNHRQESRFKYSTPVEVTSNEVNWQAKSIDFSASGLKLAFEQSVTLSKGDIVYLSFSALQKITSLFDLNSLPYEIIRINQKKTIINLRVSVDKHQHIGRAFFKALIDKNKEKLTSNEYEAMVPGLSKPLRNIYSSSANTPNLIIQTSGSRYKFEILACGKEYGKLMPLMRQLSDKKSFYNLYPLLSNLETTNALMVNLKKMHVSDDPISYILYVAINPNDKEVKNRIITKLSSELDTVKQQKIFIKKALKAGSFFCLQLKLSRTYAPDMDYLNPELSYISSYAIHRGKQIEQEIWSVSGVVQVNDITQEAMLRVKLAV